jgi:hypothetical protein
MTIAFTVPSTSNGKDWETIQDTFLYKIFLPSLEILKEDIAVYIGYDNDDKLYSNISLPTNYKNINLKWIPFDSSFKGKPCHIWNKLSELAFKESEYVFCCGDDIQLDSNENWLKVFIDYLKTNNNIGYSAGWSNNDNIPTQFLFHKKHFDIFGFIYPPAIHNWYCDDFIYGLYGRFGNWLKDYKHLNLGGTPRYTPNNDKTLCQMLIRRHKKQLNKYQNNFKYMD